MSRDGCCLCDDALAVLHEVAGEVSLEIQVTDVDSDAELKRLYGESIPVVFVDGKLAFKGHVDKKRLLKRFQGGGILGRLSAKLGMKR